MIGFSIDLTFLFRGGDILNGFTFLIVLTLIFVLFGSLLFTMKKLQKLKDPTGSTNDSVENLNESEQSVSRQQITPQNVGEMSIVNPEPDQIPFGPNNAQQHTPSVAEDNLYEANIQEIMEVLDGDKRQVNPHHFKVLHAQHNQDLDIVVNQQFSKKSLPEED